MIFDHAGNEVGRHQREKVLPQAGWVEHDPVEIEQREAGLAQWHKAVARSLDTVDVD